MAAAWTPPDDVLTRPAPPPDRVIRYGTGPEHVADVRLPEAISRPAPLVIFLHGGFWRAAYDRSHTGPLAGAGQGDGGPGRHRRWTGAAGRALGRRSPCSVGGRPASAGTGFGLACRHQ